MTVVLAPKVLSWFAVLVNVPLCMRFGGPILLTLSTLFEALLSALYAPILMVAQAQVIWGILWGHDSGWKPQRRDDGALDWSTVFRAHRGHLLFGAALALIAWVVSEPLFYWLLPITLGLVLSPFLSWISGGTRRGRLFAMLGLLRAPEEKRPAPVLASKQVELERLSQRYRRACAGTLDGGSGVVLMAPRATRCVHCKACTGELQCGSGNGRVESWSVLATLTNCAAGWSRPKRWH